MQFLADISSAQGEIDAQRLADIGHAAVIQKCTGEGNYVNPFYVINHPKIIAAKILTGSYDWLEPQDGREPEWLASDYLGMVDTLGGRPKGHLLGVDFETPEWNIGPRGSSIEEFMRRYVHTLLDKSGQGIEFYSGPYFMQETGAVDWAWLNQPKIRLWLAAPGEGMMTDDSFWPNVDIRPFTDVGIHQHQWHALDQAIGTGAEFDRDRFRGTVIDLAANGAQGDGVATPEQPTATTDQQTIAVPPEGKWSVQIMPNGNTVMVLNYGGQTTPDGLKGAVITDAGVTVASFTEPGLNVSMSFQNEQFTGYHENRGGTLPVADTIAGALPDPKA